MEMSNQLREQLDRLMNIVTEYSDAKIDPTSASAWERALFNAASEIKTAAEDEKRREEKDKKSDTIRTPEELKEHFERMYRRQLCDPANMSNWRMILMWAADYDHDEEVSRLRRAFHEAHRDDKEDAMRELFDYLLYNTDNDTYGVNKTTTVRFHMYGGGPAGGIDFTYDEEGELEKAEAWHTEWFSAPVKYTLPDDEAERLAEVYNAQENATGNW